MSKLFDRLKIVGNTLVSPFTAGVLVKRGNVTVFVNGELDWGDSLDVAKQLVEISNLLVDTDQERMVVEGMAKEARKLRESYNSFKRADV